MWARTLLAVLLLGAAISAALLLRSPRPPPAPEVRVIARLSGADAEELDARAAAPLAQGLSRSPAIARVTSRTVDGEMRLTATGAPGGDPEALRGAVAEAILTALPSEVRPRLAPAVEPSRSFLYALESQGLSRIDLARVHARVFRHRLALVNGVAEVAVCGEVERYYEVELDPGRLAAHRLGPREVRDAIVAKGLALRPMPRLDLPDLALRTDGAAVRLRDVARVRDGVRMSRCICGRDDLEQVVCGVVSLRPDADAAETRARLRDALAQAEPALPPSARVHVLGGGAALVRAHAYLPGGGEGAAPRIAAELRRELGQVPDVATVVTRYGDPGDERIAVLVEARADVRDRATLRRALAERARSLPGVVVVVDDAGTHRVRISCSHQETTARLAGNVRDAVAGAPGVAQVVLDGLSEAPRRRVVIDRAKAAELVVDVWQVRAYLEALAGERIVGYWREQAPSRAVRLRVTAAREDLSRLLLPGRGGAVPLASVVHVEQRSSPVVLRRENGQRLVEVLVRGPDLDGLRRLLADLRMPPGCLLQLASR